jgi:hypothetical protein
MDSISGLFRHTMWNEIVPTHLRGRLAGIEMLSRASGPTLGGAEAGAALAGVRASVVSGGLLCVAGTAAHSTLLLPRFVAYDARTPATALPPPAHGPAPRRGDPIRPARRTMFDLIHCPKVARQQ